jgi:hypothetical protein
MSFPGASGITVLGPLSSVTATGFDAALSIAGSGTPGAYAFTVTTPAGSVTSGAVTFTVTLSVAVTNINPTTATIQPTAPAGALTVRGTNIRDAALAPGAAATGTVVRLLRQSDLTQVLATCTNPIVMPNVGANQTISVTLPLAADFPVQTSPARVQVQFGGGSGIGTQNLTLNF